MPASAQPAGAPPLPPEVEAALARAKLPRESLSVLVADAQGGARTPPRLAHRAQVPVNPASVMKLVTTYAALEQLGPAYTWSTPVFVEGMVQGGSLKGNVYIQGQGDPKLVVERLWLLMRRLQAQGIQVIVGDIVLDRSAFDVPEQDPGRFDGEPLRPYNASPDALLLNYKSSVMTFVPDASAGLAHIQYDPPLAGVQRPATVALAPPGADCGDWRGALRAELNDPLKVVFQGAYPAACGERVWPVAYPAPREFAARAVEGMWRELGGKLTGSVREGKVPAGLKPAFVSTSPALAEVVRDVNKYSNNVMAQQLFLTLALREGIEGRVTDKAFTKDGRAFPRGTVVFPAGSNSPDKMARLAALTSEVGARTVALDSGWVDSGPNLGSESFVRLTLPRVAIAWDDGISQLSAGAMRYVLERRLGLPVTPIRTQRLARADLADYDVLLVPEGEPSAVLGDAGQRAIREFVRRGGVLVAVGDSLETFSSGDAPMLAVKREAALGREPGAGDKDKDASLAEAAEIASDAEYREAIKDQQALPDTLPGALLNVVAERDHFLSAGYDDGAVVLATGTQIFTPLGRDDGVNVLRFAAPGNLIASGYVWDENRRQLAYKPYLMAQRQGRGLVIGFAHDPSTRAYLDGLDLLIANAVLIAPSRVR